MNPLQDKWVIWFHDPKEQDWSLSSYKKLWTIETIEDFWILHKVLDEKKVQEGMFFLMKENIDPIWENEQNINGGCWSYKISKRDIYPSWLELAMALTNEKILKDENNNDINGISISPRKSFNILKIWNKNVDTSSNELLSKKIPKLFVSQCIYKSHKSRN